MQVHAFEENNLISSAIAEKGKDYFCPECLSKVRLRGGDIRQSHFYHVKKNSLCRLSQKGEIHIRLQRFIEYLFEDAEMEKPFPSIGRIADVACPQSKKVFEIQYSPMKLQEAKQRCTDYESLGYTVIWILHNHHYDAVNRLRPTEKFLRTKTCYYSDMDSSGNGIIYDRLDNNILPVNLRKSHPLPPHKWPEELIARSRTWPLYHEGDLFDLAVKGKFHHLEDDEENTYTEMYLTWLYRALSKSAK